MAMSDQAEQGSANGSHDSINVVVVTGASGVVGTALIKELAANSYELRILTRDVDRARGAIGDLGLGDTVTQSIKFGTYEEQDSLLSGANAVVHLAARNNDQGGDAADFERDNCELPVGLAKAARQNGVRRFLFATTTKALGLSPGIYGASKAKAETELNAMWSPDFKVSLVRLSPVYGPGSRGKIRHLSSLPLGLNRLALVFVRSFLPIVSVDYVAKGIISLLKDQRPLEELCLSDPLGKFSIYRVFRALMNWIFVLAVPTVLGIPVIISALAVALTSKGGVFFVQRRLGTRKRVFHCRKFRTMQAGTPIRGTHEVGAAYVTKVGGILRKLKLDELPQAINLVFREMNLIGPRPCLENQAELIEERERYGVFGVRPGITGLGQVSGVDMSEPRRLSILDHRYAAFRGILFDIKIAIATVLGRGFGDPADKAQIEE